jgi:hypothetical protein
VTKNAGSLVAYQARQKQKTIDAIAAARQAIETEMAQHGYYPQNGGHLSKEEVFRRAAVSRQTLKNATHKETAEALDRWLIRIKKAAPTLKPEAEDAKAGKIAALEKKLGEVIMHYDRFKLEYNELLHRCEALEGQNADLRRQVVESAGSKVVKLEGRR